MPAIKKCIGYLYNSFLIDCTMRYNVRGKKHIDTSFKCFFADMGLRNARLNFLQMEETYILENVMFSKLTVRWYNVDGDVVTTNENDGGVSV